MCKTKKKRFNKFLRGSLKIALCNQIIVFVNKMILTSAKTRGENHTTIIQGILAIFGYPTDHMHVAYYTTG